MSRTVDERIVDMQFNHKQFEEGIQDTIRSLDDLNKNLNNMDSGDSLSKLGESFGALEIIATTALVKLTDSVIDFGANMAKSLTIDQVTAGFNKYEQQIEAVQFIMNATNKTIDDVTGYLDKLMIFTDETSYAYMDMVNSIGKFTASGVKLDVAVEAMQGISNWAAISGRGIRGAEVAMDALSVSMGMGAVRLKEWNRIKDANMGTMEFKETVIDTAVELGKLTKVGNKYIAKYVDPVSGKLKEMEVSSVNFTEALKANWFTSEVLLESLSKYGAYSSYVLEIMDAFDMTAIEAMRVVDSVHGIGKQSKMTATEIEESFAMTPGEFEEIYNAINDMGEELISFGRKAFKAAQEAKTFTDVMNFLKDAISTKWMQTFDIIIGNFEEARDLWSDLSEVLYEVLVESGNVRNEMLKSWRNQDGMDGRAVLLKGIANIGENLIKIINSLREAWESVFPPMTGEKLFEITKNFMFFTERMLLGDETIDKITRTFSGFFAVLGIVADALGFIFDVFKKVIGAIFPVTGGILDLTAKLGDFLVGLRESIKESEFFAKALEYIGNAIDNFKKNIIIGLAFMLERFADLLDFLAPFVNVIENTFADLGTNILDGLKEGLNKGLKNIINTILMFAKSMVDTFKNFFGIHSPSKLMMILGSFIIAGLIAGMVMGFGPLIAVIAGLGAAIATAYATNLGGIRDFLQGLTFEFNFAESAIGKAFESIKGYFAKFGGIDLGPIKIVSDTTKELFKPFEALGNVVKTVFNAVKTILTVIGDAIKQGLNAIGVKDLEQLINWLLSGGILVILNKLLGLMKSFDKNIGGIAESFTGVLDQLGNSLKAFQKKTKAEALLTIAFAMGVLTVSLFALSRIPFDDLLTGIVAMAALVGVLALLSKIGGTMDMVKLGSGMALLGVGITQLSISLALMSLLSVESLIKSITAVAALLALISVIGLMGTTNLIKLGTGLVLIGIGITALITPLLLISLIPYERLADGLLKIAAILLVVSVASMLVSPEKVIAIGAALSLLGVGLMLLITPLLIMSAIPAETIAKGLIVIATALGILSVASGIIKPENLIKLGASLAAIAGGLLLLELSFIAMNFVSWEAMAKGLLTMMAALATLVVISILVKPTDLTKLGASLITIATGILLLGAAFVVINFASWETIAKGLLTLMAALALLIAATHLAGASDLTKMATIIITLSAVMAIIGVFFYVMSNLDIANMIEISISMSLLLLAIGAFIAVMSKIDFMSGIKAAGILALFAAALALLTAPFILLKLFEVDDTLETMLALSGLMIVIGAFILIIGNIPIMAGLTAVANMAIFILGLAALIAVLGGLAQIPGLSWILDEGLALLIKLGKGLGEFVGAIIGGVLEGISSSFPKIADNLSLFMTNLQPFLEGASNIDPSILDGIGSLASAILILTGASLIDGIAKFITGGKSSFVSLGKQLAEFGPYFKQYYDSISGIDSDVIQGSSNAALTLAEMANNLPAKGGKLQDWLGTKSLYNFATELVAFGPAMKEYSDSIKGLDVDAVTASANAALTLSKLANNLPAKGGVLQDWIGSKSLYTFAKELVAFGPAIKEYSDSIIGIDNDGITASANAALTLAKLAKNLPAKGGVLQDWIGSKSLYTFANELVAFGPAIKEYSDSIIGIDNDAIIASSNAALTLSKLAKNLPAKGGVLQDWIGSKSLYNFATELTKFGPAMKTYSDSIIGIDPDAVTASANAALALSKLANNLPSQGGIKSWFGGSKDMATFGESLLAFGDYLSKYSTSISNVDSEKMESVSVSLSKMLKTVVDKIDKIKPDFEKAGVNVVDGLIKGIKKKESDLKKVSEGLGKEAILKTIKNALSIHSPSEETEEIGENTIDGLDQGLSGGFVKIATTARNLKDKLLGSLMPAGAEAQVLGEDMMAKIIEGAELSNAEDISNEIGESIGESMADGVTKGAKEKFKNSFTAIRIMAEIMSAKTFEAASKWILDYQDSSNYLVDEEIKLWEKLGSMYEEHSWERVSTEIRIENAMRVKLKETEAERQHQFEIDKRLIEEKMKLTELSAAEELKIWEEVAENYHKLSSEREEIDKKIADLHKILTKEQFEDEKDAIQERLDWVETSISEEIALWEDLQVKYKKGTDERIEVDKKIIELQKALAKERFVDEVQALEDRLDLIETSIEAEIAMWEDLKKQYKIDSDERLIVENRINELRKKQIKEQFDAEKDAINERLDWIDMSIDDEIDMWENLRVRYKKGTDERIEIDNRITKLKEKQLKDQFEDEKKTIDDLRKLKKIDAAEEIALYEELRLTYKRDSEERRETDAKIANLKQQQIKDQFEQEKKQIAFRRSLQKISLIEEITEWEAIQKRYAEGTEERKFAEQALIDAIIEHRNLNKMSLAEELAAWEFAQTKYIEGTDERMQVELELAETKKRIFEEQKRITEEIDKIEENYVKAIESRAQQIYSAFGLFSEVEKKQAGSGDMLIQNLKDQVTEVDTWSKNIATLAKRGVDEGLLEELRKMGPGANAEIQALVNMTQGQLSLYVTLWKKKMSQAMSLATTEIAAGRPAIDEQIDELKAKLDGLEFTADTVKLSESGKAAADAYFGGFTTETSVASAKITEAVESGLTSGEQSFSKIGEKQGKEFATGLSSTKQSAKEAGLIVAKSAEEAVGTTISNFKPIGVKSGLSYSEGIDSTQPEARKSGENIAAASTEGMLSIVDSFYQMGANAGQAFAQGLLSAVQSAISAAWNMVMQAVAAMRAALNIKSPSRVTQEIGVLTGQGFVNGLLAMTGEVEESSKDLANSAIEGMKNAISEIGNVLDTDIEFEPTITPVLDLTEIQNGSKYLRNMLNDTSVDLPVNEHISSISRQRNITDKSPIFDDDRKSKGDTYEFTQNNYSPKVLSRLEIYRQTRNQFAQLKGVTQTT